MKTKKIKNFITFVLIASFIIPLPYITFLQKTHAQFSGGYSTSGSYGSSSSAGLSGYLKGLAPAITQLPLCKGKLNGVVKDIFTKSGAGLGTGIGETYEQYVNNMGGADGLLTEKEWKAKLDAAKSEAESIEVKDEEARKKLLEIARITKDTKKITEALEANDTCLKSIGRMITKLMLQKITVSTVTWIQGGFEGNPAFIQDPGSFFGDIAKNEILKFGLEIDDPKLYPFGKGFMRSQAEAFNSHFADNARYSLNELIQSTTPEIGGITFGGNYAAEFQNNFSSGGWNAWTGLTTVPANNPLGFHMIASKELSKRLSGTSKSTANEVRDSLAQAAGFLGDQRCADPKGLTRAEHDQAVAAKDKANTCKKWEYVTPGKMISEAATTALNYPNNNLLQTDDLNDAIAAILDALLSKFSNDFINNGFANLSEQGADGAYYISTTNLLDDSLAEGTGDFTQQELSGRWLQQHPNFNIRTDLTQAIIDEQRIYNEKVTEENKIIKDLIKTVRQLDYCIPGPHPGWEQDSRRVLSAVQNAIPGKTANDMRNISEEQLTGTIKAAGYIVGAAVGAALGSVVPGFGTAIGAVIGLIIGLLVDLFDSPEPEEKIDMFYGVILRTLTGLHASKSNTDMNGFTNKHDLTLALDGMYSLYMEFIHKYYPEDSKFIPLVAKDAALEFRKIPGYEQIIENNEEQVSVLNGIIIRLNHIKATVDELNEGLSAVPPTITETEYEEKLLPIVNEFARLSNNMVTGDDISDVNNISKEVADQIRYVYDDLLTGPIGCEQELQKETIPPLPFAYWEDKYTHKLTPEQKTERLLKLALRVPYPYEIWYDYNFYGPPVVGGTPSADALNQDFPKQDIDFPTAPQLGLDKYTDKTTSNRMPNYTKELAPAFLPNVRLHTDYGENEDNTCGDRPLYGFELDCMRVDKYFDRLNSAGVWIGRVNGSTSTDPKDKDANVQRYHTFEQTIGIY